MPSSYPQGIFSLILISLFATGVADTGGKFAADLPPLSLTLVANLRPVSTTLLKLVAKFAAGVVDTCGKFATGVVDTGGQPLAANISTNFRKKFETALMVYSGAWGKLIHEK